MWHVILKGNGDIANEFYQLNFVVNDFVKDRYLGPFKESPSKQVLKKMIHEWRKIHPYGVELKKKNRKAETTIQRFSQEPSTGFGQKVYERIDEPSPGQVAVNVLI